MKVKHVGYYRVSTEKQGESGLGLEAQQRAVAHYNSECGGELLAHFQDIESGAKNEREGITAAIEHAHKMGATILVKGLDRISRDGFTLVAEMDRLGVSYLDVDSPGDGGLAKDIKFVIAKDERGRIAKRTTAALNSIRERIAEDGHHVSRAGNVITTLGHPETLGGERAWKASAISRAAKAKSNPRNIRAAAVAAYMRKHGETFQAIADFLNANGFATSTGLKFHRTQVRNLVNNFSLSS